MQELDERQIAEMLSGRRDQPFSSRMTKRLLEELRSAWLGKFPSLPFEVAGAVQYFVARGIVSVRTEETRRTAEVGEWGKPREKKRG